jgi:hypothetical protein
MSDLSFISLRRAASFIITHFPVIKETTLEALETIFATKAVGRQLVLAVALETGMVRKSDNWNFLCGFAQKAYLDFFCVASLFYPCSL